MGTIINFGDGNGNQYIIKRDSIEYNPVKPKFSSSGIYNGGEPVKKTLIAREFDKLISIFKNAMVDEENHVKNRVKGSGAITIRDKDIMTSCILSPNSEKLNEIERILKDILKY